MKKFSCFCLLLVVSTNCFSNGINSFTQPLRIAQAEDIEVSESIDESAEQAHQAANEKDAFCEAIFQQQLQQHPYDLSVCVAGEPSYQLDQCETPIRGRLPSTHIILALNASASMANRIGRRVKLNVAKSETLTFLESLPQVSNVSVVVFGHKGDGSIQGKQESCSAIELAHEFNSPQSSLKVSINNIKAAGWTPLASALEVIRAEVTKLPTSEQGKQTTPVVYLVSDGKESCDEDPVAAARALADNDLKTKIYTIGLDPDQETQVQLQAISEASGGEFYLAESARALRDQFEALISSEQELHQYDNCVSKNAKKITSAYQQIGDDMHGCYLDNGPDDFKISLKNAYSEAPSTTPIKNCTDYLSNKISKHDPDSNALTWFPENVDSWSGLGVERSKEYRQEAMQLLTQ